MDSFPLETVHLPVAEDRDMCAIVSNSLTCSSHWPKGLAMLLTSMSIGVYKPNTPDSVPMGKKVTSCKQLLWTSSKSIFYFVFGYLISFTNEIFVMGILWSRTCQIFPKM